MRAYKQFDKKTFIADEQLTDIMYECHSLLQALGIRLAPLTDIEVFYQPYKGWSGSGICYCLKNGRYVITISKHFAEENRQDRYYTKSAICHELLHTAISTDGNRLEGHCDEYMQLTYKVRDTYGYDPMIHLAGKDFKHASMPVIRMLQCQCCESKIVFVNATKSLKSLENWEDTVKRDLPDQCSYCGNKFAFTEPIVNPQPLYDNIAKAGA